MGLMQVIFQDKEKSLQLPPEISIHIYDRIDLIKMLVGAGGTCGFPNEDYKGKYDLVVNKEGSLTKSQAFTLLNANMLEKICWLDKETGEHRPIRTLRITGEHETMVVVGRLGEGFFMKSVDPQYILACLTEEDKKT